MPLGSPVNWLQEVLQLRVRGGVECGAGGRTRLYSRLTLRLVAAGPAGLPIGCWRGGPHHCGAPLHRYTDSQ